MKFIVDLWLDGYNSEEEMKEACREFIYEQLNFTASSVSIEEYNEDAAYQLVGGLISDED